MSRPDFAAALDACIDDIAAGRRTIDGCLAAWPQFAERLRPLLESAGEMRSLPRAATSAPDAARRASFMRALHATPQQTPRRSILATIASAPGRAMRAVQRTGLVLAPAAAIAALAIVIVLTRDAPTASAATLTLFSGGVERQLASGEWQPLEDGALIREGDRVRTTADGQALITFADGSTAGLDPGTEITLLQARLNGAAEIDLRQFGGRLWNQVASSEGSYTVRTPHGVVVAPASVFETVVGRSLTSVTSSGGTVEVQAGDTRVLVASGDSRQLRDQQLIPHDGPIPEPPAPWLVLRVSGPFVATIVDPQGKATGVRADGLVYQQITGAVTSNPADGPQRIELRRLHPGTYIMLVRRIGEGAGRLFLRAGDQLRELELARIAATLEITVDVDATGRVAGVSAERIDPDRITRAERVVVTTPAAERARQLAEEIARRLASDREGAGSPAPSDASPRATATASPTAAPTVQATRTADGGAVDAPATAVPSPEPTATRETDVRPDGSAVP